MRNLVPSFPLSHASDAGFRRNDTNIAHFFQGVYPNATEEDVQTMLKLYPDVPALGAPYNTGDQFELAPQWKRVASVAGDIDFDAPHRLIAQTLGDKQPFWSYCTSLVPSVFRFWVLGS